jgi:hypothetical protein
MINQRGLTLLEAMVATTLLAMILLGTSQLMVTMHTATQTVAKTVDISEDARRVLVGVAADIRQSGWVWEEATQTNLYRGPTNAGPPVQGASAFTNTATGGTPVLALRLRSSFTDDVNADFNRWVTYTTVADGTFGAGVAGNPARYLLQRRVRVDTNGNGTIDAGEPDNTVTLAENISRVHFQRVGANAAVIDIQLEFSRLNPDWSGGVAPAALRWLYRERTRMQNLEEDRS